jgi:hypothetical protein
VQRSTSAAAASAGTRRSVTQEAKSTGSATAGAAGSHASGSAAWMPFPAPHSSGSDAHAAAAAAPKGSTAHLRGSIFKVGVLHWQRQGSGADDCKVSLLYAAFPLLMYLQSQCFACYSQLL